MRSHKSSKSNICTEGVGVYVAGIERSNMWKALRRVKSNKGGAGIDGMTVEELPQWLSENWVMIKEKLRNGSYQPQPVKAVDIPKPDGGVRTLGIPTVIDRLIQQSISQVLSNILLDRFDKELLKRGHSHVRYADDCNIYLRSKRAAERVLTSISAWLAKHLRLKVNQTKSAVDRPWKRKFLGFSFTANKKAKIRIAPKSVKSLKAKVKAEMRRGRGRNVGRFIRETLNPILRGWVNYYRITDCKGILDDLDSWIRRRLRNIIWRQWKHPRTRRRKLMSLGIHEAVASKTAYNGHGAWLNRALPPMSAGLPKKYFDQKMLLNLQNETRYAEQLALL